MHIEDVMDEMKTYATWTPTPMDHSMGTFAEEHDWIVGPISITRDTPAWSVDASNWRVVLAQLENLDPETWCTKTHGHWGPGWYQIILAQPGTEAHQVLAEAKVTLSDNVLLDDDEYFHTRRIHKTEQWENASYEDRVEWLEKARMSTLHANMDTLPQDPQGSLDNAILG